MNRSVIGERESVGLRRGFNEIGEANARYWMIDKDTAKIILGKIDVRWRDE